MCCVRAYVCHIHTHIHTYIHTHTVASEPALTSNATSISLRACAVCVPMSVTAFVMHVFFALASSGSRYVYMYICMYVCIYVWMYGRSIYIYIYIYIYMFVCVCVCVDVTEFVMHVFFALASSGSRYVCMYICAYVCR